MSSETISGDKEKNVTVELAQVTTEAEDSEEQKLKPESDFSKVIALLKIVILSHPKTSLTLLSSIWFLLENSEVVNLIPDYTLWTIPILVSLRQTLLLRNEEASNIIIVLKVVYFLSLFVAVSYTSPQVAAVAAAALGTSYLPAMIEQATGDTEALLEKTILLPTFTLDVRESQQVSLQPNAESMVAKEKIESVTDEVAQEYDYNFDKLTIDLLIQVAHSICLEKGIPPAFAMVEALDVVRNVISSNNSRYAANLNFLTLKSLMEENHIQTAQTFYKFFTVTIPIGDKGEAHVTTVALVEELTEQMETLVQDQIPQSTFY